MVIYYLTDDGAAMTESKSFRTYELERDGNRIHAEFNNGDITCIFAGTNEQATEAWKGLWCALASKDKKINMRLFLEPRKEKEDDAQ